MWILQCLLKKSREQLPTETTTTNSSRMIAFEEENEKDCDEFELEKGEEVVKNSVAVLLTRVNSRTCFYSTLNLKNLRSFFDGGDPVRPAKEERMVGRKVLPICNATLPNSVSVDYNGDDGSIKKKRRVVSQMKEILKWAATSKSDRRGHKRWKVLYFHNKDTHKTSLNKTSSVAAGKINFRWDVGSSSTASSTFSTLSFASSPASLLTSTKQLDCTGGGDETHTRMGHWITTDSEFVVLEF